MNAITNGKLESLLLIAFLCLVAMVVAVMASQFLPPGIDWRDTYRPAALALLHGESPYTVDIYFAAPWTLIPFLPCAMLPTEIGRAILFVVGLISFAYTAWFLGAKPPALIGFLISPPVMHCLLNANIEWLPLLGFTLPPQIGLLLVMIKPQIGLGVALFWLVTAWKKGRFGEVARVFWPLALATLISFVLFGFWPLLFRDTMTLTRTYNASLWPFSIPIGLGLLAVSFRKDEIRHAMAASPLLSPYVLLHAWVGALASVVRSTRWTLMVVAALWILVIVRAFTGAL